MTDVPPTYTETAHTEVAGGTVAAEPVAPVASRRWGRGAVAAEPAYVDPAVGGVAYADRTAVRRTRTVWSGSPGYRAVQITWFVLTLVETFLGLRLLFRAINANTDNGFVSFVNNVAEPFAAPFRGIVSDYKLTSGGILEIGTIIAMIVWLVVAALVARLIRIVTTPKTTTAV